MRNFHRFGDCPRLHIFSAEHAGKQEEQIGQEEEHADTYKNCREGVGRLCDHNPQTQQKRDDASTDRQLCRLLESVAPCRGLDLRRAKPIFEGNEDQEGWNDLGQKSRRVDINFKLHVAKHTGSPRHSLGSPRSSPMHGRIAAAI